MVEAPLELRSERIHARLVPNRGTNGGYSLVVDGVTQSHINPADPLDLQLEYARIVTGALDVLRPAGAALDVLTLGGGAMSVPRYLAHTRPGSRQHVVELFDELHNFVLEHLPLPPSADITAEFRDAREAVEQPLENRTYDVVLFEVAAGGETPAHLITVEFFATLKGLLKPHGLLIATTLALADRQRNKEFAAALRATFGTVMAVSARAVIEDGQPGNVELIACDDPLDADAIARRLEGEQREIVVLAGEDLDAFVGGAVPRRD